MLRQAKEGKIDLILTKSISRLARNTVDTLMRPHEHEHQHTFTHTVTHTHEHNHYVTDSKHGYRHSWSELEHLQGAKHL